VLSGVAQSRGEIEARCDSTAGDGWVRVGPREAKKPGRKGNADPEGWGSPTYLSHAIEEVGQRRLVGGRIDVVLQLRTIQTACDLGIGSCPLLLLRRGGLS